MSPELRIKDRYSGEVLEFVGDVPDQSGIYSVPKGKLRIKMDGVNPKNPVQKLVVELPMPEEIKRLMGRLSDHTFYDLLTYYARVYKKEIHLSAEGIGSTLLSSSTILETRLHEPIRRRGEWKQTKPRGSRYPGANWIPRDITKPQKR